MRGATRNEIVGVRQFVRIPRMLQPNVLDTEPWPSACRWLLYRETGAMETLSRPAPPCPQAKAAERLALPVGTPPDLPVKLWRFIASKTTGDGYIVTSRSDDTQ